MHLLCSGALRSSPQAAAAHPHITWFKKDVKVQIASATLSATAAAGSVENEGMLGSKETEPKPGRKKRATAYSSARWTEEEDGAAT